MEYKNIIYGSGMPSYLNNSLLMPRNFYNTGFESSLENIVLNDEPEAERGMIDKVFSNKSRTLKATVRALFNQILTRERLNCALLGDIDSDMCKTGSYLEQIHETTKRQYDFNLYLALSRRRTQLESRILDLKREARQEYLACFRDLSLASRYLLNALKDYWNISNRKSFLGVENDEFGYRSNLQETQTYPEK